MQYLGMGIAIVVAVASALGGLWLAGSDSMSLVFVGLAVVTWVGFAASLALYWNHLAGTSRPVLASKTLDQLGERWSELRDSVQASLVGDRQGGSGKQRRTRSTASLLRNDPLTNAVRPWPWLSAGQAVLVSLGLFGTFVGLSYGLRNSIPCFDSQGPDHEQCVVDARQLSGASSLDDDTLAMQHGMNELLGGARTAFSKSVAGIGLGLSYMLLWRLAERRRVTLLHDIALHVDRWHSYVSPEDLNRELLETVVGELRESRRTQPDGAALTAAAAELGVGAKALAEVAQQLGGVSEMVNTFKAETIANEVSKGVRGAVDESLAPTLEGVRDELKHIHTLKVEQDTVVRNQLKALVDSLRVEVLDPLGASIQQTNLETRRVAETVDTLSVAVDRSTRAVSETTTRLDALTTHLTEFQEDTLGKLTGFASKLEGTLSSFTQEAGESFKGMGRDIRGAVEAAEGAMAAQRVAFSESANEAKQAFASQTGALTSAGAVASAAIKGAGEEASSALLLVKTEFAGALSDQRGALQGVLASLGTAFNRDLDAREAFTRNTEDALARLAKLQALTTASDAATRQAHEEARNTVGKTLNQLRVEVVAMRETHDNFRAALEQWLGETTEAQQKFRSEEDKHLASVIGQLYAIGSVIADGARRSPESPKRLSPVAT